MATKPSIRLGFADDKVQAKPELRDCIDVVLRQADGLANDVLVGLRNIQPQSKGRGAAIRQSPQHSRALDLLLSNEVAFKLAFTAELKAAFFARRASDAVVQPVLRFDDFQFLDDNQIDTNIEIALTQQEVSAAVDVVLPALNGLVSALLGMVSVQPHLNPLKPEAFVQALRATMTEFVQDAGARSAILSVSATLLGQGLLQLYKELTTWLRSHDIEPALPGSYQMTQAKPGSKEVETTVSKTMLTLDKLKRLLTGDFESSLAGGPKDFLHTVPASFVALQDMKLVEPMMKRLAKRASQSNAAVRQASPVVDMLTAAPSQNRQMGQQLGSEVVRLMVDNLSSEERLLPKVRTLVKDMEPTLLQLAHADPRFFTDRKHPARLLIDRITNRSLAYASENDEGFARFSKTIGNSIQVLVGTNGDAPSFARVLRKLEEGWEREDAALRKHQEEAARALLHAEQRNMLAQKFADDFAQRLKDKEVPEFVANLLRGPWAQAMAESQLRSADGVSDPAGFGELVDDLVWSVQLRLTRRNANRLVQMVPSLLVKLRQGLQLVDYPEERIPLLFDNLIGIHEQAFEHAPSMVSGSSSDSADGVDFAVDVDHHDVLGDAERQGSANEGVTDASGFWLGDHEAKDSGYLIDISDADTDSRLDSIHNQEHNQNQELGLWAVSDLRVGAWVELNIEGQWIRAQLTWASPHLTLFMFVSGRGLAHSMSRRTMEQRRVQGMIRIVSDGDVVGDALDAVAQTALRNQAPVPTGPAPLS